MMTGRYLCYAVGTIPLVPVPTVSVDRLRVTPVTVGSIIYNDELAERYRGCRALVVDEYDAFECLWEVLFIICFDPASAVEILPSDGGSPAFAMLMRHDPGEAVLEATAL